MAIPLDADARHLQDPRTASVTRTDAVAGNERDGGVCAFPRDKQQPARDRQRHERRDVACSLPKATRRASPSGSEAIGTPELALMRAIWDRRGSARRSPRASAISVTRSLNLRGRGPTTRIVTSAVSITRPRRSSPCGTGEARRRRAWPRASGRRPDRAVRAIGTRRARRWRRLSPSRPATRRGPGRDVPHGRHPGIIVRFRTAPGPPVSRRIRRACPRQTSLNVPCHPSCGKTGRPARSRARKTRAVRSCSRFRRTGVTAVP